MKIYYKLFILQHNSSSLYAVKYGLRIVISPLSNLTNILVLKPPGGYHISEECNYFITQSRGFGSGAPFTNMV